MMALNNGMTTIFAHPCDELAFRRKVVLMNTLRAKTSSALLASADKKENASHYTGGWHFQVRHTKVGLYAGKKVMKESLNF